MTSQFSVPEIAVTKDLIERVQFSVSSRNAEAKVSECATHVFASRYVEDAHEVQWQYIASGVTCLLRNRELAKGGRKYVWSMNLCLYNAAYGVLVWKGKLSPVCGYTAVSDTFHVFSMSEVDGLIGLLFSERDQALEIHKNYLSWHQERMREEKTKGGTNTPPTQPRFRKEMISKPCNFQHIQGTQALDECLEIEKIKADIQAALFGLGPRVRTETDSMGARKGGKKKKDVARPKLEFGQIATPHTSAGAAEPYLSPPPMEHQAAVHNELPYQPSYTSPPPADHPGHTSPPPPPQQQPYFSPPPPPEQQGYFSPPSSSQQQANFTLPPPPPLPEPQVPRESVETPQGAPLSNPTSEGAASYYSSSRGSYHGSSQGSHHSSQVTSPGVNSPHVLVNGYPQPQEVSYHPPTTQDVDEQNGYHYGYEAPQGGYVDPAPQGGYVDTAPQGGYMDTAPQGGYMDTAPQGGYMDAAPQGGYLDTAPQGGYIDAAPQGGYLDTDLSVDAEVEQYMKRNVSESSFGLDLAPPPRLSPLTLEDDFFGSPLMSTH